MELRITNEQKVRIVLNPVTAAGKPASLDGAATFTVQDDGGTSLTLVPDADGKSCFIVSDDEAIGAAMVKVEADVNMSPDVVETISDLVSVIVSHPQATSLGISAETPVPK